MLSALFAATAAAQCSDRQALLDTFEQQVVEGRFEESDATSDALIAAFGCGAIASPEEIARMWLAFAVLKSGLGDNTAQETFAAAARASEGTWNDMYGPSLRASWEAAARMPSPAPGQLRIEPDLGYLTAIDGRVMTLPAELPAGPHLLQMGTTPDEMKAAFRFELTPTLERVIDPKLPPLPPLPLRPLPRPERTAKGPPSPTAQIRKRRVLNALVVGAAGALVYSGSFATHSAFYNTPPEQRTGGLRALNDGLVLTSAALATTSAVMLVSGFTARAVALDAGL